MYPLSPYTRVILFIVNMKQIEVWRALQPFLFRTICRIRRYWTDYNCIIRKGARGKIVIIVLRVRARGTATGRCKFLYILFFFFHFRIIAVYICTILSLACIRPTFTHILRPFSKQLVDGHDAGVRAHQQSPSPKRIISFNWKII